MRAYHFVGKTLRDGRPIPSDGEWLEESGTLKICQKGLHASLHVADAVRFAPGTTLCLVELDGETQSQSDKVCAARRKIIARFDATELLRADARASALSVIHLWKSPVPDVVKRYLETGDESIRVEARQAAADAAAAYAYAAYAAYAAAYAAADADAYAAYADAAYAAADARRSMRDNQRARIQAAVDAKFAELGVTPSATEV